MSDLFTIDELRRLEEALYFNTHYHDLLDKIKALIDDEYRRNGPGRPFALTPTQLVKQMILDSPLARLPDVPFHTVNVAIAKPFLTRLLEAVEAL